MKLMDLQSRRGMIGGFLGLLIGSIARGRSAQSAPPASSGPADPTLTPDALQIKWVANALNRMSTIRTGMTRADLEKEFYPAGGFYGIPTYSYRGCEYFKVTVDFRVIREPHLDAAGHWVMTYDPKDIITKISKPFVEQAYSD